MEITTRQADDVLVVEMAGRLDTQSSGPASEEMARIVEAGNGKILLNLGYLEFISSAGLRVLLRTTKLLPEAGRMMICQANGIVKEVLEGELDPPRLPAQTFLRDNEHDTHLFLDEAAASLLEEDTLI